MKKQKKSVKVPRWLYKVVSTFVHKSRFSQWQPGFLLAMFSDTVQALRHVTLLKRMT